MLNSTLSKRYAKAIFELAVEAKVVEKVEKDLAALQDLLGESANLREAVQNPVVSRLEQKNAMEFILKTIKVTPLTNRFVSVLIDNGRLSAMSQIIDAYFAMLKVHRNEIVANVVSASALTGKNVSDIEKTLGTALNKKVQIESEVDKGILGGVIIKIGSKMLDASVSGGLEKLKTLSKEAIA